MHTTDLITATASKPRLNWVAALSTLALLIVGYSQLSLAQKSGPETFSSPGKATSALFQAVQNSDEEALERILGAFRTNSNASASARNIRRCTVWFENPMDARYYISARKTGPSPSLWSQRTAHGTSIPIAVNRKFCFGPSGRMRPPQSRSAMFWQKHHEQKSAARQKQQAPTRSAITPKASPVADLRMLITPLAKGATSRPLFTGTTFEWCQKIPRPEAITVCLAAGRPAPWRW